MTSTTATLAILTNAGLVASAELSGLCGDIREIGTLGGVVYVQVRDGAAGRRDYNKAIKVVFG